MLLTTFESGSKLAESYYGNGSIFYISEHNIAKWLRALSQSHYQLLDEVRMTHKTIHKEKVGPSESSFRKLAMRLGFEHFKICNRIETAPIHQNRALLDNGDRTMTKKGVHLQVVFGQPEGKVWISHQFLGRLRKMRDRDFGARSVISEEDLHKILDVEHERQRQGRSDRPGLTNTELDYCYG